MNHEIIRIEELVMNAHPALKTQLYDGWVLGFSNGYTNRANSVNPIYPFTEELSEKISICQNLYTAQNLPTVYKLTEASPKGLDELLDKHKYEIVTPTTVMTIKLKGTDYLCHENVTITNQIEKSWLKAFFGLCGISDEAMQKSATAITNKIQNQVLCAKIKHNNKIIACGLGVVERGYIGLFDIVVHPSHRKQGMAYALCSAILQEAKKAGVNTAYLQVINSNSPAKHLYQKLGFEDAYQYWYRVKK